MSDVPIFSIEEALKRTDEIREILKKGGVGIFPTDTVYGIAAYLYSKEGIEKIYRIKGRDRTKPLVLFPESIYEIEKYIHFTYLSWKGFCKLLPGKVTIITKKGDIPIGKGETIGFRIPGDYKILELIEKIGIPLATTSANLSGKPPMIEINQSSILKDVDFVIDMGKLPGIPSTVIDMSDRVPVILRKGAISIREIEKKIGIYCKADSINILFVCTGNICRSPMAKALADSIINMENVKTESAGISADYGESISDKAAMVLNANGIPFNHSSKPINRELVEWADFILVMENRQVEFIRGFFNEEFKVELLGSYGKTGEISDPYGMDLEEYEKTFNKIKKNIIVLKYEILKRLL